MSTAAFQLHPFPRRLSLKLQSRAEDRAADVLTVLRVRGVAVPDAARERILAQRDPTQLERWLERAIVAAWVAEVSARPGARG